MSQYTTGDDTHFSDNTNSFNVWNNCTFADDRSQLLAWLSPLEPKKRHRDIQERRMDNVGEWLLKAEEFKSWHDWSGADEGGSAALFYYGNPGVGKTFISSLVVDKLCDKARGQGIAITCFYFDFAARKEQSVTNMLGSLVKQVVGGMERVPEEISRAFQEQKLAIGGREPRLPDIVKMLQAITSSLRTFICIDALDECITVHRVKLLSSLKQILEKSPRTRIFITGRPHIRAEIEKRLSGRVMSVSIGSRKDDIIEYLRVKLDEDETPDAMDESLMAEILEKIPENISEMFLLASLNIEAIIHESTIHRRREKLSKMTDGLGLGGVYGTTIERIKAQNGDKSRLGMAALMWISHAERPLQADELCHALAVEIGSVDFYTVNVPSMSTLVNCCQGLISVDKEASTVRLVHLTLQEYLSAHHEVLFSRPHSAMVEICLTYLNSQQVKALSAAYTQNTPFLEYCSVYWGIHAKRELSDCARPLALELLRGNYSEISTRSLMNRMDPDYARHWSTYSPFSGLHCASFFGIVELVTTLIEMECYGINEKDFSGGTPLRWAAHNGHEEVVKILLGREVDPDEPDSRGQTPLLHAAWDGHEGVVKILLGREEVNPDKPDKNGRTPLTLAAWGGHEGVVQMLLAQEEVNPDKADNHGQTPLSLAAWDGHVGVVKVLLGREEVNPDKPDNYGRTPLSLAAWRGREGVVETLLAREEVNHDKPDEDGRTPLSLAARYGHEGVVKILLTRGEVNPDKPDNYGRTPLTLAAWDGRDGVVEILLAREEVNPDASNTDGRTPLLLAALDGHERVVKVLLGQEEVNPVTPDKDGETPLSVAAMNNHTEVVALLQAHGAVTSNAN